MRRYAEDTAVPISRSRGEIDKLLREWKADAIQWSDDFARDRVTLRFIWPHEGLRFVARFHINLLTRAELSEHATDNRTGGVSENKLAKLIDGRGRTEHRVLLLWLKAALNAVELGIVTAEALFLPFLEDQKGETVAEMALPRLAKLLDGAANRLLPAGDGR